MLTHHATTQAMVLLDELEFMLGFGRDADWTARCLGYKTVDSLEGRLRRYGLLTHPLARKLHSRKTGYCRECERAYWAHERHCSKWIPNLHDRRRQS